MTMPHLPVCRYPIDHAYSCTPERCDIYLPDTTPGMLGSEYVYRNDELVARFLHHKSYCPAWKEGSS
jgi:hypothetical protein